MSPLLMFHISAGVIGIASGALAMTVRKGWRWHRVTGTVFFASMLGMSAAGALLALMKTQTINTLVGVLTFYLVATAWATARRKDGEASVFDLVSVLVALAVGGAFISFGIDAANGHEGPTDGPAPIFFVFGSVALLAAALDIRVLIAGGVAGVHRIARHVWRMCVPWFIAVTSLFLGQDQVFPAALRKSGVLYLPGLLVLVLFVFWMVRVLFTRAFKEPRAAPEPRQRIHPFPLIEA